MYSRLQAANQSSILPGVPHPLYTARASVLLCSFTLHLLQHYSPSSNLSTAFAYIYSLSLSLLHPHSTLSLNFLCVFFNILFLQKRGTRATPLLRRRSTFRFIERGCHYFLKINSPPFASAAFAPCILLFLLQYYPTLFPLSLSLLFYYTFAKTCFSRIELYTSSGRCLLLYRHIFYHKLLFNVY